MNRARCRFQRLTTSVAIGEQRYGWTCCWFDAVAIDPFRSSAGSLTSFLWIRLRRLRRSNNRRPLRYRLYSLKCPIRLAQDLFIRFLFFLAAVSPP